MKKLILLFSILAIVSITILLAIATEFDSQNRAEREKYQENLGKTVVLGKDTLIITNYSIFLGQFRLSNGSDVSSELIFKR